LPFGLRQKFEMTKYFKSFPGSAQSMLKQSDGTTPGQNARITLGSLDGWRKDFLDFYYAVGPNFIGPICGTL
jgi:hypothetical protein